ncbi:MAG: hypothetical protein H6923_08055 [Alphaproteobacteria bacterium]|nr:hypothetical protein [Alphaproteobacteria bacterium]
MTMRKKQSQKKQTKKELVGMPFDEALERFILTDPDELSEALQSYDALKEEHDRLSDDVDADQDRVIRRMRGKAADGKVKKRTD